MEECNCFQSLSFGTHTIQEHVDGKKSRCGICAARSHYTLDHARYEKGVSRLNKGQTHRSGCGFCGSRTHTHKQHVCTKCRAKGEHRSMFCPRNV